MRNMKNKLALGNQELSEIIKDNCIYVDKTEDIYRLLARSRYYFLSRPRRFGKSLLINTIKEIFKGNKELFKDLWIYDKWNWEEKYPVIKMSFANIDFDTLGLENAISRQLKIIAKQHNIVLNSTSIATQFDELIYEMANGKSVVILIDEYDKPIIDYMDNIPQAEKNRKTLKKFYSIIKDANQYIKFMLITGVSKFSQVSIFSDLNNLSDLTMDTDFATITGFTRQELEDNFAGYIAEARQKFTYIPDIMEAVKDWYNGYSWNGIDRVYNPVSIMNFFQNKRFSNYWFSTGTPTMLIEIIKRQGITAFDIDNRTTNSSILNKYDFKNINLTSLLFQTGYLTIESINEQSDRIKLSYPNKEVEQSFSQNILADTSCTPEDETISLIFDIEDNLVANKIDDFIENINDLFKNIPYTLVEKSEKYFHSLFFLVIKLVGFHIDTEVLTINGRIDAVVKTEDNIFIIEFKINQSAKLAIEQIKNKKYADKYKIDKKTITLLGINFDVDNKKIDDYSIETL